MNLHSDRNVKIHFNFGFDLCLYQLWTSCFQSMPRWTSGSWVDRRAFLHCRKMYFNQRTNLERTHSIPSTVRRIRKIPQIVSDFSFSIFEIQWNILKTFSHNYCYFPWNSNQRRHSCWLRKCLWFSPRNNLSYSSRSNTSLGYFLTNRCFIPSHQWFGFEK